MGNPVYQRDGASVIFHHVCQNDCDAFSADADFSMACDGLNAQGIDDVCQYGCIAVVFSRFASHVAYGGSDTSAGVNQSKHVHLDSSGNRMTLMVMARSHNADNQH